MISMTSARKRRLAYIIILVCFSGMALGFTLYALNQNINLFFTPAEVAAHQSPVNHIFRLGGLVKTGSVIHGKNLDTVFILQDPKNPQIQIKIFYQGILPALFREGQDIIVQGKLNHQHVFMADQVLAKHDAQYHPA